MKVPIVWISQITDYQTPGFEGSWLLENAAVLSSPAVPDQFPSEPFESSSTAEDAVTVGTHHVDDVISASAHTEPTTEAPTPTTPACIDVAPDESISMDDLLTETVHQVDQESAAFIHQMETDLLCGLLARKWCSIGCELVQSYVGTEMEYIRILQGKESQTDDEYAEEDFGVEDAADNDDYADKDFENLVKQFRVDEKMCYYPFPKCGIKVPSLSTVRAFIVLGVDMPQKGSSNELHVEIEPVIDKDAFIHITSYPEDVYFPEDCGIILNKLTIRLTQVSHLAQP
eukprot:Em0033g27a